MQINSIILHYFSASSFVLKPSWNMFISLKNKCILFVWSRYSVPVGGFLLVIYILKDRGVFPLYWFRKMSPTASTGLSPWHDFLRPSRCSLDPIRPYSYKQVSPLLSAYCSGKGRCRQRSRKDGKKNWGKMEETQWSPCEHAIPVALQIGSNKPSLSLVRNLYYSKKRLWVTAHTCG